MKGKMQMLDLTLLAQVSPAQVAPQDGACRGRSIERIASSLYQELVGDYVRVTYLTVGTCSPFRPAGRGGRRCRWRYER